MVVRAGRVGGPYDVRGGSVRWSAAGSVRPAAARPPSGAGSLVGGSRGVLRVVRAPDRPRTDRPRAAFRGAAFRGTVAAPARFGRYAQRRWVHHRAEVGLPPRLGGPVVEPRGAAFEPRWSHRGAGVRPSPPGGPVRGVRSGRGRSRGTRSPRRPHRRLVRWSVRGPCVAMRRHPFGRVPAGGAVDRGARAPGGRAGREPPRPCGRSAVAVRLSRPRSGNGIPGAFAAGTTGRRDRPHPHETQECACST